MSTQYLSVKQVAEVVGVDPKTIYKMISRRQIPGHFRLGSLHLIDREIFMAKLKLLAKTDYSIGQSKRVGLKDPHGLL